MSLVGFSDDFGGPNSEEQNALRTALKQAASDAGCHGEYSEYDWLDETPRTTIVVELVDALHKHGYHITKQ